MASNESSAAESGFILLANLGVQILTVSIRHVHHMTGVLAEVAKPQITLQGLMHVLGLIEKGLHRVALIHRQLDCHRRYVLNLGSLWEACRSYSYDKPLTSTADG